MEFIVFRFADVEHGVHHSQTVLAVQCPCPDANLSEVVQQIDFHMLQPRLCLPHIICSDAEGQVFGLGQAIVALRQLPLQHGRELGTDAVKPVSLVGNPNHFLKVGGIRCHVHEGQLKLNGAVEEIQKAAPFFKDGGLVLLLCQLIVDILKLDGFGVVVICHTANAIREHPLERNTVLCGVGYRTIPSGFVNDFFHLGILLLG